MNKALAYCACLHRDGIYSPASGVAGAPLQEIAHGELRVLWSEAQWPFADSALQKSAVEFHQVISHMFSQGAVVPFRLLSLFEDSSSLAEFIAAHADGFVADLRRLEPLVQMECVLYPTPEPGANTSGTAYLQKRAAVLHGAEGFVRSLATALGPLAAEMRVRESSKGSRIFVLVQRGNEKMFHTIARELSIPEGLNRRTSGPWPPSEFLSDSVKMPEAGGANAPR